MSAPARPFNMVQRTQPHARSAEASVARDRHTPPGSWKHTLGAAALVLAICLLASLVDIEPPHTQTQTNAVRQSDELPAATRVAWVTTPLAEPASEAQCQDALRRGNVPFRPVPERKAQGVEWPVMLTGAVAGVRVEGDASDPEASYLDCRLGLAILAWAPQLRAQGVVALQHYSMYRHDAVVNGGSKPSGHARGTALDVASFEMKDGRKLSVLDDWLVRTRGSDPCATYARDSDDGRALRAIVCDAVERALFQTVITPHYNDAHGNHVHLEIGPPERTFVH